MKDWKIWKIVLFIIACVCLNVGGKFLAVWLELPLWLDSFGTALAACIAGPFCGAMVGFTANMSYCVVNNLSAAYSITNIALGIILGIAARKNWFDRFYGFMKAASLAVVTALVLSVPINIIFDSGFTGNKWGNGVKEADDLAREIYEFCASRIINRRNGSGGRFRLGADSVDMSIFYGRDTGATPDGRFARGELARNFRPELGLERGGITAFLKSVNSLDGSWFTDGAPCDFVLHPSAVEGEI